MTDSHTYHDMSDSHTYHDVSDKGCLTSHFDAGPIAVEVEGDVAGGTEDLYEV